MMAPGKVRLRTAHRCSPIRARVAAETVGGYRRHGSLAGFSNSTVENTPYLNGCAARHRRDRPVRSDAPRGYAGRDPWRDLVEYHSDPFADWEDRHEWKARRLRVLTRNASTKP